MQDNRPIVVGPSKDTSTWAEEGRIWEATCRPQPSSRAAGPQGAPPAPSPTAFRTVESVLAAAKAAAGATVVPQDAVWKDAEGRTHHRKDGQESVTLEKVEAAWVPAIGDIVTTVGAGRSLTGEVIASVQDGASWITVDCGDARAFDTRRVTAAEVRLATPEEATAYHRRQTMPWENADGGSEGTNASGAAASGPPPARTPLSADDATAYAEDYEFLRAEFATLAEEAQALRQALDAALSRIANTQAALDVLGPVLADLKAKVAP